MCTAQVCIQPFIQRVRWKIHGVNLAGASSKVVESITTER